MPQFFLGGIFTSVRERVADTFTRNNRNNLGRASDGSLWQTIRAGLGIANSRASALNPLDNPISTVDMPFTDVQIDLNNISQGAGAAIWVQSSDDWWAVTINQEPRDVPESIAVISSNYSYSETEPPSSGTTTAPFWSATFNSGSTYNVGGNTTVTNNATGFQNKTANFTYTAWNTFFFKYSSTSFYRYTVAQIFTARGSRTTWGWARSGNAFTATGSYTYRASYTYQITSTTAWSYTVYVAPSFAGNVLAGNYTYVVTIPGYQYTAFAPYNYSVTVPAQTVIDQKVNIRQAVAGNVALIKSWLVSSVDTIRSLRVRLSDKEITTTPYSDPNQVSQIGENLVYEATGATITQKFGLTISPSAFAQGTTAASSISISN